MSIVEPSSPFGLPLTVTHPGIDPGEWEEDDE